MAMTLGSGGRRAEINLTPMIDIMLVLIVMFLIITPITPRGLQALVPQDSRDPHAKPPERPIVIEALLDGTYRLNSAVIEPDLLQSRLRDLVRVGSAEVVFIKGDQGIEYERAVYAIDAANSAGVGRIALMPN
jgi:biopolymer transport protein ExbD